MDGKENEDNMVQDREIGVEVDEAHEITGNLILNVEELIALAMGEPEHNTINFKILQAVLYVLTRQMKFLNQRVEIVNASHFTKTLSTVMDPEHITASKIDISKTRFDLDENEFYDKNEDDDSKEEEINTSTNKSEIKSSDTDTSVVVIAEHFKGKKEDKNSIEVVTMDQFMELKKTVEVLLKMASPIPLPTLPHNEKLKSDIVKGTASLTDTMKALNVSSRLQAAEKAVEKLVDLLTYLAANGSIPSDISDKALLIKSNIETVQSDTNTEETEYSESTRTQSPELEEVSSTIEQEEVIKTSAEVVSDMHKKDYVTLEQMMNSIRSLRDDLMRDLHNSTTHTGLRARGALSIAKNTAENVDQLLKLSDRVHTLQTYVDDHTHILQSFTETRDTQIEATREQMGQMLAEVNFGIEQIATYECDTTDVAIMGLKDAMAGLVISQEDATSKQNELFNYQNLMAQELKKLRNEIQLLRLEKADRDEVQDGLRDKADISLLDNMVTQKQHDEFHSAFDMKLFECHDKFQKQNDIWMQILKDFTAETKGKITIDEVNAMRNDIQRDLETINEKVHVLARYLSDPKAIIAARKLGKDAVCACCLEPTRIDPRHVTSLAGLCKVQLPALGRQKIITNPDDHPICLRRHKDVKGTVDAKTHACHRWVGGSHTAITKNVVLQEKVEEQQSVVPVKHYYGLGTDGKAYRMQKNMSFCMECNAGGDGDASETADSIAKVSIDKIFEENLKCMCDST